MLGKIVVKFNSLIQKRHPISRFFLYLSPPSSLLLKCLNKRVQTFSISLEKLMHDDMLVVRR